MQEYNRYWTIEKEKKLFELQKGAGMAAYGNAFENPVEMLKTI